MISIEAHRAAIGRFYGKAKIKNKFQSIDGVDILIIIIFLLIVSLVYGAFIGFIYMSFDLCFYSYFLPLVLTYCSSISIICMYTDILAITFQKTMCREKIIMKPFCFKTMKSIKRPLDTCKYVDTFMLDGRDTIYSDVEAKIIVEDGQIYVWFDDKNGFIKSRKIWDIINKICCYILLLVWILVWLYVTNDVFMNKSVINHNFKNYKNDTQNYLEMYLLNHLKLAQLLIDGDIESHPGPVTNDVVTPKRKGRPPKKGFRGRKLDFDADMGTTTSATNSTTLTDIPGTSNSSNLDIDYFTITDNITISKYPVRLRNEGVNACFINTINQVLYSLPQFHLYLYQTLVDNPTVTALKTIFQKMRSANGIVQTSNFLNPADSEYLHIGDHYIFRPQADQGIDNYTFRSQYDAQEALQKILDNCYPDINRSMFCTLVDEVHECDETLGGCGKRQKKLMPYQMIKLEVDSETIEDQNVEDLFTQLFTPQLLDDPDPTQAYRCALGPNNEGCNQIRTVKEYMQISNVKDVLILHLKIFRFNLDGTSRKIHPSLNVPQDINQLPLQAIIWHHGETLNCGHYTATVKHNGRWYHLNDTVIEEDYLKFFCNQYDDDKMTPYLLFYGKGDISSTRASLNIEAFYPTDSVPFTQPGTTNTRSQKRAFEPTVNDLGDDLNSEKIQKFENFQEEILIDLEELDDETEKSIGDTRKVEQRKYNFSKRKCKFFDKKQKRNNEVKEKMRATPEGKKKQQEYNRISQERIRATPEGKKKDQEFYRKSKERIRATDEGRKKNQETTRESMIQMRNARKIKEEERVNNLPFPPKVDDEDEKRCIKNFIDATSPHALKTSECGICGIGIRNVDGGKTTFAIKEIPNLEHLLTENQENPNCLEEYIHDVYIDSLPFQLLLSPGGVDGNQVTCCKSCLTSLKNDKLPIFSVANNFQIGKTPPELMDLTLSEKLLISKYRPKMYVVKLRSTCGPQAQQKGLKGNTITFAQDVVKMASTLPANPDILTDHLRVVFIGKSRPTSDMLKKVFTVRREKVYNALNFLSENNPVYADVTISNTVDLPIDDVPKEIMETLQLHDDSDDEDANNHSTYTPQTDLDDIPEDTFIMDSVGMVDLEGSTVRASDQITSAIHELQGNHSSNETNSNDLQGTIIVPHGSVPVNEYNNPNLWLGAYPWLFPYGRGGPEVRRTPQVGLRGYIKHLLKLADRKFSLDPSLKFHAFNVIQKRDVSYHTSLHVRRPGFYSNAARINSLTQESMQELLKCVESKTPITDPNLKSLMNSLSSAGKNINGSPYQKSTYRRQIFGLMIQAGSPVLWITLSPAVTHSPLFLQIAGHNLDPSRIPSNVERAILVANDPVASAIYFNTVIDAFTKYLLGYKQRDGGAFGHPSAYYGMTEEQGTGTLHNHMLVWLHNFESASKFKSKLEDATFTDNLLKYLERIIKQGYLDSDEIEENLDVSEVSCKYPVERDDPEFNDDVNNLVTVANTHSCRGTCFKYRKKNECRFCFPRELVAKGHVTEENEIKLKRTNPMINNYNPSIMTCIRSNHDIKFIPSGKDGKNIAFYVTNYATKSQLSTHNMVPLIAASKKRLDQDTSIPSNVNLRAKFMITKCLNRITTETEISGAHVSHFLLGYKDNKTSHSFTALNLHCALAWLANAIKVYEAAFDLIEDDESTDKPRNSANASVDTDDDEDDEDDNEESPSFTLSTGNEGLVFVNQMTDYINRGEALKQMCLWEYSSKVYKEKYTDEKLEKQKEKDEKKKTNREVEKVHLFLSNHPQSETHWQKVRIKGSYKVPTLSKLPPSSNKNKLRYQKCILLLFKPFTTFEELYNGISWNETFLHFLEVTDHRQYVENIEELHKGIEDKEENNDNNEDLADEIEDDECENDSCDINETDDADLDTEITAALEVIRGSTPWLQESISSHRNEQGKQPLHGDNSSGLSSRRWEDDMKNQNQDKKNDIESDECEQEPSPTEFVATNDDNDVDFSMEQISTEEQEHDRIRKLREDVISEHTLNKKQQKAFEIATDNIIKRYFKEKTEQLIGYIGGPGGTGKSQVIKAIVAFHQRMKVKHTLKMSAHTGTASKHIGGSTTTTLFGGFSSGKNQKDNKAKLQTRFEKLETIIIDEVSMIGCRQLLKIASVLSAAKCVPSSVPFGGVDMIFFGDFMQFPPVKDSPLYCGWNDKAKRSSSQKIENQKKLAVHLWKQINKIVLLDKQMRCTDQAYLGLLDRLREGKCNNEDVAMLRSRIVGNSVQITSILDAPIITPGNQLVMAINDLFTDFHSQCKKVYISTAKDYIGDKKNGKRIPKEAAKKIKKWPSTKTDGLPRELQLYIGMPVIVTRNIHTELGITNGTVGWVRLICFTNGEVITGETGFHHIQHPVDHIIVELQHISVKPLDGLPPNHIPIFPKTRSFSVSVPGKKKALSVNRCHFPLVPRFSCTAHKSQGQTLSKAIIDLAPRNGQKTKGLGIEHAYVPLSRVRTLKDLTILRPFDAAILKAQVNEGCAAMMAEFKSKDLCKDM